MSFILSLIAAALYIFTSVLLYRCLSGAITNIKQNLSSQPLSSPDTSKFFSDPRRSALAVAFVAFLIHAWVVSVQTGFPAALSLPLLTALSATSLTIVFLLILLCLKQPAHYLGIAIYPIAALSLLCSHIAPANSQIEGGAIQTHVFLSLVAYAVLALAAAQAVLVAIQRRHLSNHKPGGFMRALPALDRTEGLLFTLLTAGFILLSLSLLSGFFYLEDMFAQSLAHKTVLSCLGWLIFAVLLFGRWQFGWRGKKAVQWTLAGFVLLLLAYFGSKIVLEIILK